MKRICLVTHCEATHTVDKIVGGWYDSALTKKGEKQASGLAERIEELGFNIRKARIFSSDLKRARQTAQILAEKNNLRVRFEHRLREMSFGTHGGMPQQLHNSIMQAVAVDGNRMDHRICEGAESRREVATRISEFIEEVMNDEQDVIIITHGFAATFLIAAFQKIDISSMGYINYRLKAGSISILEEDDLFKNRSVRLLNA